MIFYQYILVNLIAWGLIREKHRVVTLKISETKRSGIGYRDIAWFQTVKV